MPIRTSVYNHNFTTIDKQPPGPDYEIAFPFQVQRARRGGRGPAPAGEAARGAIPGGQGPAAALGADVRDVRPHKAGEVLANRVLHFMRLTDQREGIRAFGYTEADIPRLVEGTLVQARLLRLSPVAPTADLLTQLFHDSLGVAS